MSMDGGGLTPREHDEIRDLVIAGTQRIRPARDRRAQFVAGALALLLIGGVSGAVLATVVRDDGPMAPSPALEAPSDGWVAFTAGREGTDVYMVKGDSGWTGDGSERVPLQGDDDSADDVCPAFSPDGSRLVAGRSGRTAAREASVVLADIAPDGSRSGLTTIPLEGVHEAPCAQWSPSGEWVAFGADMRDPAPPRWFATLWFVNTTTHETRTLRGLSASDFAWSPDGTEVYVADSGQIRVHALSTGETRTVEGVTDAFFLDASPDGRTLAVARGDTQPRERFDLWVMGVDGSDQTLLVEDYLATHGVGPVWSPEGDRIVLQRICDTFTNESGDEQICREQHLAVVVDVTDGAQMVIAAPAAVAPGFASGRVEWYPFSVTWSPDATRLLYVAWPQGEVSDEGLIGVLSVPADGSNDPVVLYSGSDVSVYSGFPWNTMQSWGPALR